jgi:co-chaperonin GroES (HSP10)
VLAVGPGGLDKDGKRVSCNVSPGDRVLIPQVSWECFFKGRRKREENMREGRKGMDRER